MKKRLLILIFFLPAAQICPAQKCEHTDLSKKYDYAVSVEKAKDADGDLRISEIKLQIIAKANKKQVQQIIIAPGYLFQKTFTDCATARSFITGKNKNEEAVDNDYGDFVTADFNFDGREDFAVKKDSGGNGGAFYEYYTQNKFGKFEKDAFLTDEIGYFPGTIDARKKRLITYIHANAHGFNENIYKYDPATKKWIFFKQTYRRAG